MARSAADGFINALRRTAWRCGPLAWIVAVNAAVYLGCAVADICGADPAPWLSLPQIAAAAIRRPWTLITYMVTQYSFLHLIFNMLWLWWFGQIYSLTAPARRIAWIYGFGGIAGGLVYIACGAIWNAAGSLCGSSAAVLAVMTATALRSPDYPVRLFLLGTWRLKWIALAAILLAVAGFGGISGGFTAHIGGVAAGAAFHFLMKRRPARRRATTSKPARSSRELRKALASIRSDNERLDSLLDKISLSGYDSLSRSERHELQTLSSRLKKNQ